jgi:tetratricopeptide (TPR) repeat protein
MEHALDRLVGKRMRGRAVICLTMTLAVVSACGAAKVASRSPAAAVSPAGAARADAAPSGAPANVYRLEPVRIEVVAGEDGDDTFVVYDARELFDRGNAALLRGAYEEALATYRQVLADFPDSKLVSATLFNAGLAHEGEADFPAAIERYRTVVAQHESARDVIDALIRIAALEAELQRWGKAADALQALLDRSDLRPRDRVEGLARLGYVLVELKDYAGAEEILRSALRYREEVGAVALEDDYFSAMAGYYLAQIPHREFSAIPIRLPDKQTVIDMESKADRLLIAHDRYLGTIELGNPFWALACGYQIAAMQREFWQALVVAPVPPHLVPEAAAFYVKEVHRLSRQFLEKSLRAHRKNLYHARRLGIDNQWVAGSQAAVTEISDILARESRGEIVVPEPTQASGAQTLSPPTTVNANSTPEARPPYMPGRVNL